MIFASILKQTSSLVREGTFLQIQAVYPLERTCFPFEHSGKFETV